MAPADRVAQAARPVAHDGLADVEAGCLLGVDGLDRDEDGGSEPANSPV
jgi:hypothetical protein